MCTGCRDWKAVAHFNQEVEWNISRQIGTRGEMRISCDDQSSSSSEEADDGCLVVNELDGSLQFSDIWRSHRGGLALGRY
uniref:Uncharacterized protein n=1 Tax=Trichuris muris TaxID=70415 RepID=A0A5S6QSK6_TRIMR